MKTKFLIIFLFCTPTFVIAQNLADYKYLLKGNATGFLLGRLVAEIEIPKSNKTSFPLSFGIHNRDYFYDKWEDISTCNDLVGILPAPNAYGFSLGGGIRSYFHWGTKKPKGYYFEVKGNFRWTFFGRNFRYHLYDEDLKGLEGNQMLGNIYLSTGNTKLRGKGELGTDFSIGITTNFANLNTNAQRITQPNWPEPIDFNDDKTSALEEYHSGNFTAKPIFFSFRIEMKIIFLKKAKTTIVSLH